MSRRDQLADQLTKAQNYLARQVKAWSEHKEHRPSCPSVACPIYIAIWRGVRSMHSWTEEYMDALDEELGRKVRVERKKAYEPPPHVVHA